MIVIVLDYRDYRINSESLNVILILYDYHGETIFSTGGYNSTYNVTCIKFKNYWIFLNSHRFMPAE